MGRKKILIVDDDKDVLRGLSVRLKTSGYDIIFAPMPSQPQILSGKKNRTSLYWI